MEKLDVVIIGSGLSGLLCASILSREGFHVCVLEKQDHPGGGLQTFERKNIAFDTGLHYTGSLAPGQTLYRYWKYFGLTERLKLIQLDKDCFDLVGIEDRDYPLAQGFENFKERLVRFFPEAGKVLSDYTTKINEVARAFPLYNLELPGSSDEDPYRSGGYNDFLESLTSGSQKPEARSSLSSVLAGNNFIYSGHPFRTPLYIPAIINHSFISSAWRFVDGSDQITEYLVSNIKTNGGIILTNAGVTKITPDTKGFQVTTSSGREFRSEYVISSLHPAVTLQLIDRALLRDVFTRRIEKLENTASAFTLYVVLRPDTFPYLNYNFYYHSKNNTWTGIIDHDSWPDNYLLYTPAFSGQNKFARALVLLTTMDTRPFLKWDDTNTGQRGQEYKDLKEAMADKLLSLAEMRFPGLRGMIDVMDISTPLDWKDYTGTPDGSMFGIQKDYHDPVRTTVNPRTKIPGLFLTGQNINLHGALGVTTGAVLTCGHILGMEYLLNKIKDA